MQNVQLTKKKFNEVTQNDLKKELLLLKKIIFNACLASDDVT